MDFYLVINVLYLGINKWILASVQSSGSPPWSVTVLRLPHGPHSPTQWLISVSVLVLVLFIPPPLFSFFQTYFDILISFVTEQSHFIHTDEISK